MCLPLLFSLCWILIVVFEKGLFIFFSPANQFEVDLTPRKSCIKLMIQEELTKLADDGDDEEEDISEKEDDDDMAVDVVPPAVAAAEVKV